MSAQNWIDLLLWGPCGPSGMGLGEQKERQEKGMDRGWAGGEDGMRVKAGEGQREGDSREWQIAMGGGG